MHSEETENEFAVQSNYRPFIIASFVYLLLVAYTDLFLFGIISFGKFYSFLPIVNLVAMAVVITSILKVRFNIPVILILTVEVLMLVPSLFIFFQALFTGHTNIDFFRTMIE